MPLAHSYQTRRLQNSWQRRSPMGKTARSSSRLHQLSRYMHRRFLKNQFILSNFFLANTKAMTTSESSLSQFSLIWKVSRDAEKG